MEEPGRMAHEAYRQSLPITGLFFFLGQAEYRDTKS
jgi:hypothetical protein